VSASQPPLLPVFIRLEWRLEKACKTKLIDNIMLQQQSSALHLLYLHAVKFSAPGR
jgi:hypothetical protein